MITLESLARKLIAETGPRLGVTDLLDEAVDAGIVHESELDAAVPYAEAAIVAAGGEVW